MKNVSQRNAPGAISAIALIVRPPSPNVGLVVGFSFDDMYPSPFDFMDCKIEDGNVQTAGRRCPKDMAQQKKSPRPANGIEDFVVFQPDTSLYRVEIL